VLRSDPARAGTIDDGKRSRFTGPLLHTLAEARFVLGSRIAPAFSASPKVADYHRSYRIDERAR
jgi:hypothetical protein